MRLLLLGLALLAGDVIAQSGFVHAPSAPLLPVASTAFHRRPISTSPIRRIPRPASIRPHHPIRENVDPCRPTPCGPNTLCEISRRKNIAQCRCVDNYVPDGHTINGCKTQCVRDDDCPDNNRCQQNRCVRVCTPGACGLNAECEGRNHKADCNCPSNFRGNPAIKCSYDYPEVRQPEHLEVDLCIPSPCGTHADCRVRGERPVCSCPRGYDGDPLTRCNEGECIAHEDCANHLACQNLQCFDPCGGVCGDRANCKVRNHQPICSCPRNYIGDPFRSCRRLTEYDICNPSPCGQSTNCKVRRTGEDMRAVCSCIDNYLGNPLTECRPECVRDNDCSRDQECRDNRCRNPCVDACGEDAYCDVRNHRADCSCPEFSIGDPHNRCHYECTAHTDCRNHQACFEFRCIDPCHDSCGTGADCKIEDHTPICSCPRGYTGDPFISCRPFTLDDLCRENPCGTNADCTPGKDRQGNDRPVCTCPRAYIGNPLVSCQRGECEEHNQCPNDEACYAYVCQSPCYYEGGSVCGEDARCKVENHQPICSCARGYEGDPLRACRIAANARVAGSASRRVAGGRRVSSGSRYYYK